MHKKIILAIFVIILAHNFALAKTSEKDTVISYWSEPVIVTGSRVSISQSELPSSISVVSKKLIEEQSHIPLLDLVSENVPSLFVTKRTNIGYGIAKGSGGNISIRGVGGSPTTRVLVLIDGRPDIMGMFGHPLGDAYFMHNVKKVEVIRGPASLLYGSNAMGGAINIITSHDHKDGFHIKAPLRYGSFNTKNGYFRQTYGGENWGYALSGGYRDSDGYRQKGNDSYTSKSGNFEFNWHPKENLKIYGNSYISDMDINDPGQISKPYSHHWFDVFRMGGDLTFEHKYEEFTSKIKVHHNYGHHEIHDANDKPNQDPNYISNDQTTGLIATETWQYESNSHLTVGFDLRNYGGQAKRGAPNTNYNSVQEYSGMAVLKHNFLSNINFNTGIRYTDHSVVGSQIIPAAGVSVSLPGQWIAKAEYSKGYRNPTIKDLYLFPPSNKELKPEIMNSYEVSIKKNYYDIFTNTISIFYNEMENLIVSKFVPKSGPAFQNTGTAETKGVEIEGQLIIPPRMSINWSGSWADVPLQVTGSPKRKLHISAKYMLNSGFSLKLGGKYVGGLNSVVDPYKKAPKYEYTELDDYYLFDFTANYKFSKRLSFFGKIENLTNEEYQTMNGYPMPGRTATVGLTLQY